MQYMRKRKMYALAVEKLGFVDMPKCAECHYSFNDGYEWLKFITSQHSVKFTVYKCGVWSRVVLEDENGVVFDKVLDKASASGILTCRLSL